MGSGPQKSATRFRSPLEINNRRLKRRRVRTWGKGMRYPDLGFDAIDAGPLRNARYLEPLSLLNIHLGRVLDYGTRIGFSLLRSK